ncbi:MAG: hypothetical protein ABIR46_03110 [Candidatus Saccharimonadales bacterium]
MNDLSKYNKALVAVVGVVLTWALATYGGDPEWAKWLSLASAIATALGVYQVPNKVGR